MPKTTRLNFLIDDGLNIKLNNHVKNTHIPKSQVIRLALEYYLEVTPTFDNVPKLKKLIEDYLGKKDGTDKKSENPS